VIAETRTSCIPRQIVCTPGSPSPVLAKKPPIRAIKRNTSLICGLRSGGRFFPGQEIGDTHFIRIKKQLRRQFGASSAHAHQMHDPPCDNQIAMGLPAHCCTIEIARPFKRLSPRSMPANSSSGQVAACSVIAASQRSRVNAFFENLTRIFCEFLHLFSVLLRKNTIV
jgi:hypothetical protein